MTLDREQWLHLARANAEILRTDLEKLRALLTDGPRAGYAEFWAQARDMAEKFKTFKPLEAEDRETLWSEYRGVCDATRALQESERFHLTEASKAKRAELEAALDGVAALVEAAQTAPELSKAQSLLDQILNQMKTKATKPRVRKSEATGAASTPQAEQPAETVAPDAEAVALAEFQTPPAAHEESSVETADDLGHAAEMPPAPPTAAEVESRGEAQPVQADFKEAPGEAPSRAGAPTAQADAHPRAPLSPLLRADREACWQRWTVIRDTLRAKRAGHRKEAYDVVVGKAELLRVASETEEPRAVQDSIRSLQTEIKESGLSLAEQESVRAILRTAWKACSARIDAARSERQKAHTEWVERMTTHLGRWEIQQLRNQVTAVQIQGEVADLERQAASTSDEEKISKLRRWIDGKRARLAELEASSKELEKKVHTVRVKMGKGAPAPITELSEEEVAAIQRRSSAPQEERRPRTGRPDRPARPDRPRREARAEMPKEPPSHPGLNLGELLAKHLNLSAVGTAAEAEKSEAAKPDSES